MSAAYAEEAIKGWRREESEQGRGEVEEGESKTSQERPRQGRGGRRSSEGKEKQEREAQGGKRGSGRDIHPPCKWTDACPSLEGSLYFDSALRSSLCPSVREGRNYFLPLPFPRSPVILSQSPLVAAVYNFPLPTLLSQIAK